MSITEQLKRMIRSTSSLSFLWSIWLVGIHEKKNEYLAKSLYTHTDEEVLVSAYRVHHVC